MKNQDFEPEYDKKHYIALSITYGIGVIVLLCAVLLKLSPIIIVLASIYLIFIPPILKITHIRKIEFGKNMVIIRFLLTDRYFNYPEFKRLCDNPKDASKKKIQINSWNNNREFLELCHTMYDRYKKTAESTSP